MHSKFSTFLTRLGVGLTMAQIQKDEFQRKLVICKIAKNNLFLTQKERNSQQLIFIEKNLFLPLLTKQGVGLTKPRKVMHFRGYW